MKRGSKKGISPIIGYILLVTFVIILGVIIYNWIKTFVPRTDLECPDGTSLFIKDYSCSSSNFSITFKNNGKFNVGGYFIYATTSPEQELATRDLSFYIVGNASRLQPNGVKFSGELNSLAPTEEETDEYSLSGLNGTIYSVQVVPIRWQKDNRMNRLVSCTTANVRETITCS